MSIKKWIVDILTPVAEKAARAAVSEVFNDLKAELENVEDELMREISKLPSLIIGDVHGALGQLESGIDESLDGLDGKIDGKLVPIQGLVDQMSRLAHIVGLV